MVEDRVTKRKLGGIFVIDPNQRIVEWSEGAATLVGVPVQEALGRPCYEVVQGRDAFDCQVGAPGCRGLRALERGHWSGQSSLLVRNRPGPPLRLQCELTVLPSIPGGAVGCLYIRTPHHSSEIEPRQGFSLSPLNPLADVVRDLSALATLATSLSAKSPQESLELALDILREVTSAEAVEVFLTEPGRRGMVLACHSGLWKHAFSQITRFSIGQGFPGLVLAHKEPIVTRALPEDPRYLRTRVKEKGFRSYVCVPIHGFEGIMGSLNVAFRRPDADLDRVLNLLSWARGPLAMMLKAGFLHLRELGNAISLDTGGDLEGSFCRLLNEVLRHMVSISGAQAGILNLLYPKGKGISRRVIEGPISAAPCPALEADTSQVCPALIGGYGFVLNGSRKSWPLPCQHTSRIGTVTYCVPMSVGGEVIGLVQIAYQEFSPMPPTRNLVEVEEVAESVARIVRDARKFLEVVRRTGAARRQRLQMETSITLQSDQVLSPELAKAQQREGQPATPHLDIRCLGPFELYRMGSQIMPDMVQRRKALELLKILLSHDGRPVTKDTLIELLWPEVEPKAGAGRLHVVIHALRRLVEPPGHGGKWVFIHHEGSRYYFNTQAHCFIDVEEFKKLVDLGHKGEQRGNTKSAIHAYEAAVQLYRGDFLEDEPYVDWCWMAREHFRETCLNVLKRLASLCAKAGDSEQSMKHLRRALRIDPPREEVHRELMRSLWAARRRDEALRQYEVCRELLKRDVDVAPLPETDRLAQLIRSSPGP